VERQLGRTPPELKTPRFPIALAEEWLWFCDLDAARSSSGFGILPVSFTEMQAYFTLCRLTPSPQQIRILRRIDSIALAVFSELNK
jgi:hypothetical protein